MRLLVILGLLGLVGVVGLMLVLRGWSAVRHARAAAATPTVGVTETVPVGPFRLRVYVGAASDARGRVHVAFRDMHGETRYIRRDADGTWSPPRDLGGRGRPFVIADGDDVTVLVLAHGLLGHTSADGGETWSTPVPHDASLIAWDGDLARTADGAYVLVAAARLSALNDEAYVGKGWAHPDNFPHGESEGEQLDLWALRSDDRGRTWSAPARVAALQAPELGAKHPILLYERGIRLSSVRQGGSETLYAVISIGGSGTDFLGAGMHLASSVDGGATWLPLTPLDYRADGPRLGQASGAADVVSGPDGPRLVFNSSVGMAIGGLGPGGRWDEVNLWSYHLGGGHSLTFALDRPDGSVTVVWKDMRRARREWYAGTGLEVLGGGSGVWNTTDLLVRTRSPGGTAGDPRSLTPLGSYVRHAWRPVVVDDRLCALWSGKTNAGRSYLKAYDLYLTCHPDPGPA